jgi:Tfp pilus assembly protein PilO
VKQFDLRTHLKAVLGTLAGLLVINLGLFFMVTQPRLADARNADETTADLAGAVEGEESRVDALEERVKAMQRSREALRRFFEEDLAMKSERLVAVQREIHRIATTFQVEAAQIKFTHEPVDGTDLVHLGISIPLSGGYNNLRQFISKVEHSDLFLIIESVQLQEGEQGGSMLNLNVRLATYFATENLDHLRSGSTSS